MERERAWVAARLPALAHRSAHDGESCAGALDALVEATGGIGAGDLVWRELDRRDAALGLALTLAERSCAGLGVAVAVGAGPAWDLAAGGTFGPDVPRVRRLVELARVGEVLATPGALDGFSLPDGVGVHGAPAALSDAAGFPVRVLRRYC